MKNPYEQQNGNPFVNKELNWLKFETKKRQKDNPFVDKDGFQLEGKFDEWYDYNSESEKLFKKNFAKLPKRIQDEIKQSERAYQKLMKAELQ